MTSFQTPFQACSVKFSPFVEEKVRTNSSSRGESTPPPPPPPRPPPTHSSDHHSLFHPFVRQVAVATAQNFGIIGNGKQVRTRRRSQSQSQSQPSPHPHPLTLLLLLPFYSMSFTSIRSEASKSIGPSTPSTGCMTARGARRTKTSSCRRLATVPSRRGTSTRI